MSTIYNVVLIGGTSHTGKSTIAQSLATRFGWCYRSTDGLARHPGRPWKKTGSVPRHVAEHYLSLSPEALLSSVLQHYKHTVWPLIDEIISSRLATIPIQPLVLEGSAILPNMVAERKDRNITALYLTADYELLKKRIYCSSQYGLKSSNGRAMVDNFLERAHLFNEYVACSLQISDKTVIAVKEASTVDSIEKQILMAISG